MRIILIADLHLSIKESYGYTTKTGINSRVYDKINALSQAVDYAIQVNADLFIDLGDTFNTLNPPEILRYLYIKSVSKLIKHNIPLYIVMGNHVYNATYYNLQSEEKLLNTLGSNQMKIISTPTVLDFNGLKLMFLPWSPLKTVREFIRVEQSHVVFHHLPIQDALLNDYETRSKEGLNSEDLKTQPAWFGGHYHKHQIKDNWAYVGSLVKQDFGERNQEKGFLDLKITFDSLDFNFIKTRDREFIQLNFEEPQDPIDYIKNLKLENEPVIKTVFSGTKKWLYQINKTEYLTILKDLGASRVLQPEINILDDSRTQKKSIPLNQPFERDIKDYCKEKKKEKYTILLLTILSSVRNSRRLI